MDAMEYLTIDAKLPEFYPVVRKLFGQYWIYIQFTFCVSCL